VYNKQIVKTNLSPLNLKIKNIKIDKNVPNKANLYGVITAWQQLSEMRQCSVSESMSSKVVPECFTAQSIVNVTL